MSEGAKDWIIKQWGTSAQFFEELERFHKQHENADAILYDTEIKLPAQAVYYFKPMQIAKENYSLMMKIAEAQIVDGED